MYAFPPIARSTSDLTPILSLLSSGPRVRLAALSSSAKRSAKTRASCSFVGLRLPAISLLYWPRRTTV